MLLTSDDEEEDLSEEESDALQKKVSRLLLYSRLSRSEYLQQKAKTMLDNRDEVVEVGAKHSRTAKPVSSRTL